MIDGFLQRTRRDIASRDCSWDLEPAAIDYRARIDGIMFFANDETGALIPESLIASFAARFFVGQ